MSAFLTGTSVVMVPVGATLWLRSKLLRSEVLGLVLVAGGLPWLCGIGAADLRFARGEWLGLGCAVAAAVQILVVSKHAAKLDAMRFTIVQLGVVLVASAGLAGCTETDRLQDLLTLDVLFAVAFTGILATTLAFWCKPQRSGSRPRPTWL